MKAKKQEIFETREDISVLLRKPTRAATREILTIMIRTSLSTESDKHRYATEAGIEPLKIVKKKDGGKDLTYDFSEDIPAHLARAALAQVLFIGCPILVDLEKMKEIDSDLIDLLDEEAVMQGFLFFMMRRNGLANLQEDYLNSLSSIRK